MAHHIPYTEATITAPDFLVSGNEANDAPVQFVIAPAEGLDRARIRSIVGAVEGLSTTIGWAPRIQEAVQSAFRTSRGLFVNTIVEVRNLTAPAALAKRVGIITEIPMRPSASDGALAPDPQSPIAITTGAHFDLVAPFLLALGVWVALEIDRLSSSAAIDARFFGPGSGSSTPGPQTPNPSTARGARSTKGGAGTAGFRVPAKSRRRSGIAP